MSRQRISVERLEGRARARGGGLIAMDDEMERAVFTVRGMVGHQTRKGLRCKAAKQARIVIAIRKTKRNMQSVRAVDGVEEREDVHAPEKA